MANPQAPEVSVHLSAVPSDAPSARESKRSEATIETLRVTVELMDNMSRNNGAEIQALAILALRAADAPDGVRSLKAVTHALRVIARLVGESMEDMEVAAQAVGCNHVEQFGDGI